VKHTRLCLDGAGSFLPDQFPFIFILRIYDQLAGYIIDS
jgi:hypothetical protein